MNHVISPQSLQLHVATDRCKHMIANGGELADLKMLDVAHYV